ncbi:MAG: class I SAM-dependent methyltransferase [Acidimicrobiia bacterium]|nr:class I SAM-dependent methyltransferase [Acidimicrobiia bacterium]
MPQIVDPNIERYATEHTSAEPPELRAVAAETREKFEGRSGMLTGHLEGAFLHALVAMTGARRVLEIGMFTGYSAMAMASALPAGGTLITLDVSEEHAEVARRHIDASPWRDRIEIRMGPALDTLGTLDGPFDLVFIDADKTNYRNYYESVLPKLSDRGVIAIDNVLWSGRVLDDADTSDDTRAIRELNNFIAGDDRVECVMLTIRDGVTLIRPRT